MRGAFLRWRQRDRPRMKKCDPRGGRKVESGMQFRFRGYQVSGPFSAKASTKKSMKARTLGWV